MSPPRCHNCGLFKKECPCPQPQHAPSLEEKARERVVGNRVADEAMFPFRIVRGEPVLEAQDDAERRWPTAPNRVVLRVRE